MEENGGKEEGGARWGETAFISSSPTQLPRAKNYSSNLLLATEALGGRGERRWMLRTSEGQRSKSGGGSIG